MTMREERWLPITLPVDYTGLYQISDQGQVLGERRLIVRVHTAPYWQEPRIIAPRIGNKLGHYCVTLYDEFGTRRKHWVHRLVALHFIPNPHDLPYVLHGPKGPAVNRYTELRWGDQSENEKDKLRHKVLRQEERSR